MQQMVRKSCLEFVLFLQHRGLMRKTDISFAILRGKQG